MESTITVGASFHPSRDGWLVYDEVAKKAFFDGGRLSERARALTSAAPPSIPSAEALRRKTPTAEVGEPYYAFARVTKRSDRTDVPLAGEDD